MIRFLYALMYARITPSKSFSVETKGKHVHQSAVLWKKAVLAFAPLLLSSFPHSEALLSAWMHLVKGRFAVKTSNW